MVFGVLLDMQKSVNKTLKTSYSGKEWKSWFKETAEKIIDEIDGASATDVVCIYACIYACMYACIYVCS